MRYGTLRHSITQRMANLIYTIITGHALQASNLQGIFLCMHRRTSCGVISCLSVLCHNHGCEVGSAAAVLRSGALLLPPYPGASFGYSLFQAVPAETVSPR